MRMRRNWSPVVHPAAIRVPDHLSSSHTSTWSYPIRSTRVRVSSPTTLVGTNDNLIPSLRSVVHLNHSARIRCIDVAPKRIVNINPVMGSVASVRGTKLGGNNVAVGWPSGLLPGGGRGQHSPRTFGATRHRLAKRVLPLVARTREGGNADP